MHAHNTYGHPVPHAGDESRHPVGPPQVDALQTHALHYILHVHVTTYTALGCKLQRQGTHQLAAYSQVMHKQALLLGEKGTWHCHTSCAMQHIVLLAS
jgi:hypothetical protein